jgi:hypothetical protein
MAAKIDRMWVNKAIRDFNTNSFARANDSTPEQFKAALTELTKEICKHLRLDFAQYGESITNHIDVSTDDDGKVNTDANEIVALAATSVRTPSQAVENLLNDDAS